MRFTKQFWTVVGTAGLALAACSSDEADTIDTAPADAATTAELPPTVSVSSTAVVTTADTVPAQRAGFSVGALLTELPTAARPADGELVLVAGDLDLATELAGLQRPPADDPGDIDALFEWVKPLGGIFLDQNPVTAVLFPEASVPRSIAQNAEVADEFGWSVLNVHSFIELQHPPDSFAVLHTDAAEDDLTAAIGEPADGIWRLGGEDGSVDPASRTPARPLGESLRFAMKADLLAVSRTTPPVEAWLNGGGPTFADEAPLASVAAALDDAGVYSAMILDDQSHEDRAGESPETLLAPFDMLGVGLSMVGGDAVGTFVYHHTSPEAAEANMAVARSIFEDGMSLVSAQRISELAKLVDVAVVGTNVVATVSFVDRHPVDVWRMILARDLPTFHS